MKNTAARIITGCCWVAFLLLLHSKTSQAFQPLVPPSVGLAEKKRTSMIFKTNIIEHHHPHSTQHFRQQQSVTTTTTTLPVSLGAPNPDEKISEQPEEKLPQRLVTLLATPIGALAILVCVVLFHETGHYLMARSLGVAVDEFSIGFGPKLASLGDTFNVRALPLGGYVSINRASMSALPWLPQVQILSNGVFFNLLLAWLIYTGQIWMGEGLPVPVFESGVAVGGLVEADPKKKANPPPPAKGLLQPGDIIHAVNGKVVLGEPTTSEMEVNRAIDKLLSEVQATPEGQSVIFTVVDPKAAPERARQVKNVKIQPRISTSIEDGGTSNLSSSKPSVGVYLLPNFVGMDLLKTNNPFEAATLGARQVATLTKDISIGILTFAKDNLSGKGKTSNYRVSGPVDVMNRANKIVQTQDWRTILNYTAAASINLGIFNFLPIPPMDGFQILITTIHALMQQHP